MRIIIDSDYINRLPSPYTIFGYLKYFKRYLWVEVRMHFLVKECKDQEKKDIGLFGCRFPSVSVLFYLVNNAHALQTRY